jgi:hypothetical protein
VQRCYTGIEMRDEVLWLNHACRKTCMVCG